MTSGVQDLWEREMESEVNQGANQTGRIATSPPDPTPTDTPEPVAALSDSAPTSQGVTESSQDKELRTERNEQKQETLVLKMSDGRTVSCQIVSDGTEKYLKEVAAPLPPAKVEEARVEPKTISMGEGNPSSFSRSSQFVSSVNSMLEENASHTNPEESRGGEGYKRTTLELFEPIPTKLLKKHPQAQQWTEQGRRLANFVEDSIYRSLKSNDADAVKEWQLKMNREAFHEGMLNDGSSRGEETRREEKEAGEGSQVGGRSSSGHVHQTPCPLVGVGETSEMSPQVLAQSTAAAKNGKVSLLDVLREKLRRTLLNYDQQVRQDSQTATRSIDTLFFSPAVESTTPDSQSAMPSSSDDVFGVEREPAFSYCDADSANNSTDESCSDRPSSTQSVFPASSSQSENVAYPDAVERGASDGALDLSCASQKGKGGGLGKRKSTSDFSLERILARPDPKPKPKHNPFMQTFSDLLDLPPREIKNREPVKVKRRPYRRRRDLGHLEREEGGDNLVGETESEAGGSRLPVHAPIGYLAITEDEYQRSLANSAAGPEADWPSVALLMNVYSEWKLKNRGITPGSPLTSELGHGIPIPGLPTGMVKASPSSASPPPTQSRGGGTSRPHHRSSCSSDCSSRSAGHVYSKKSRLLQNIERSCSCKSHHSRKETSTPEEPEDATRSTIRALLNEEMAEKKKRGRMEAALNPEEPDSLEGRMKRPRVAYEDEVQLRRDPDAQGVCVIS